jgi:hypothetical protein
VANEMLDGADMIRQFFGERSWGQKTHAASCA